MSRFPVGASSVVTSIGKPQKPQHGGLYIEIDKEPLLLYCTSQECNGIHYFDYQDEDGNTVRPNSYAHHTLVYRCRHCKKTGKVFFVVIKATPEGSGLVNKVGEWPEPYDDKLPRRVQKLLGSDWSLFLKGRGSENRGFGIGALTYYRRVVENQKSALIDGILGVLRKLDTKQEVVERFEEAKKEAQFSRAIEKISDVMPESLFIEGHNPLKALHAALSVHIHEKTDDECLTVAQDIRVLLVELAARLETALRQDRDVKEALARLLRGDDAGES